MAQCNQGRCIALFLSTPSARRATMYSAADIITLYSISIHALREEGDFGGFDLIAPRKNFYPRPPRGGRLRAFVCDIDFHVFLSTPSARRATAQQAALPTSEKFLSTPSARRATDYASKVKHAQRISIHALREEGDLLPLTPPRPRRYFYPRPPRGGRRRPSSALLVVAYFYPRPPRGGRQQKQRQNLYFQTNYTTFCTNLEEP